jgi:ABC-2 type transport system permease protein
VTGLRQGWLVAVREIRERLRSPVYYLSLGLMLLSVASFIVVPSLMGDGGTRRVTTAGATPAALAGAIEVQAKAADVRVRVRAADTVDAGEQAVRDGDTDVLVVDGRRLEWRHVADDELKAVVTGAIQMVAVRERAAAAGITPEALQALLTPVAVRNVELGQVAGRSEDDEAATYVLSLLLFISVSIYGGMVLTGVVEEKSSRVVEVLLARIPAGSLLAGKVAGIGLLGLAQVAITGVGALVAIAATGSADVPAARGSVVAWAVLWFVLGYALIATAYGVLGSLTSRSEDASSVTGPLTVVLIGAYFVSFAAIGSPDELWARLASWFPVTAPFAMPNRIAMGAASWWEPMLAAALTIAAIAGLVVLGGRIYTHAILRTGGVVRLGEAWRGARTGTGPGLPDRWVRAALGAVALTAGAIAGLVSGDVVLGVTVGAVGLVLAVRMVKARTAHRG